MKHKFSLVALFALLLSVGVHAQKDGGAKKILSPAGDLVLPVKAASLTKKLNIQPEITTDEEMGNTYYEWVTPAGLKLGSVIWEENKEVHSLRFSTEGSEALSGLPYGLVLNKTTTKEAREKFKGNIKSQSELYEMQQETKVSGYSILVKKGKYYIKLLFKGQRLESVEIADYNMESAG